MLVCFRAVNGLFHLLYMTLKDRFSLTVHTYCLLYHFLEWYSKANHSIFKWATRSTSRVRIIKTLQNSRLFQNIIAYRLVLVPNELSPFLVSMLIRPWSDFFKLYLQCWKWRRLRDHQRCRYVKVLAAHLATRNDSRDHIFCNLNPSVYSR